MSQYHQTTMILGVDGRFSISKRTKHIKAWYSLIKYRIEQGGVEVQYCPI